MSMEDAIILYPSLAIGHLISMVELGKLILDHYPSFYIKILMTTTSHNDGSTAHYINRISATTNSITFHHLPLISSAHHEALPFELLRLNNPNVHKTLVSISENCTVRALIIDFFCTPALSVAAELKIPAYYFITSGACCLASFLYISTINRNIDKSLKDLDTHIHIPGLPPLPSTDKLDRNDNSYECFLNVSNQLPKSAGIIVNTFELLESRVIKAISDGLCVPDEPTPPLYCIGPLIAVDNQTNGDGGSHECLEWLDRQPSRSVVFLCFGSRGLFSSDQLREMALGLERSGQRFLWVVRSPPVEDQSKRFLAPAEPELDVLFPDGFLDRTKERGLVIKSWAPQVAVLNHDSVGGFVTHCGWNSVLEAVCAGVPMVAWPLYAEQRLNRVVLVEEMKLVLPMKESEDGFVSSAEVEKRVRELMDTEEGNSVRKKVLTMKATAKAAMSEGGSSRVALSKLVESWTQS